MLRFPFLAHFRKQVHEAPKTMLTGLATCHSLSRLGDLINMDNGDNTKVERLMTTSSQLTFSWSIQGLP